MYLCRLNYFGQICKSNIDIFSLVHVYIWNKIFLDKSVIVLSTFFTCMYVHMFIFRRHYFWQISKSIFDIFHLYVQTSDSRGNKWTSSTNLNWMVVNVTKSGANATISLARFENKKVFFWFVKHSSLLQLCHCGCKFRSRRIGSGIT
jgi:hypothetical protein